MDAGIVALTRMDSVDGAGPEPRNRRFRLFLVLWFLVSMIWIGGVAFEICHRARVQAAMAQAVERELDAGSCAGASCATSGPSGAVHWRDIVQTYMQFGFSSILEWAVMPPLGALVLGSFGLVCFRRRDPRSPC